MNKCKVLFHNKDVKHRVTDRNLRAIFRFTVTWSSFKLQLNYSYESNETLKFRRDSIEVCSKRKRLAFGRRLRLKAMPCWGSLYRPKQQSMVHTARVIGNAHAYGYDRSASQGAAVSMCAPCFKPILLALSSHNLVPRALFSHLGAQMRERSLGIEVKAPL